MQKIPFICSLRAIYGTDEQRNGLHGSDSYSSAAREIRFFFPDSACNFVLITLNFIDRNRFTLLSSVFSFYYFTPGVVEPVPVGQAARDYLAHAVNPTLLKGLTELCKQKPQDPVVRYYFAKYPCRVKVYSLVHGHSSACILHFLNSWVFL